MSEARGGDERSYPTSEVRGGEPEIPHTPKPEARSDRREELPHAPKPEARGGGREDQSHVQGAVAAWAPPASGAGVSATGPPGNSACGSVLGPPAPGHCR